LFAGDWAVVLRPRRRLFLRVRKTRTKHATIHHDCSLEVEAWFIGLDARGRLRVSLIMTRQSRKGELNSDLDRMLEAPGRPPGRPSRVVDSSCGECPQPTRPGPQWRALPRPNPRIAPERTVPLSDEGCGGAEPELLQ